MPPPARSKRPRLAILFRYGGGEHIHFLPALPELARELSAHYEIHHFGFRSDEPVPDLLRDFATLHTLPFRVHRRSEADKRLKTLLWLLALPLLGIRLSLGGYRMVFLDETIPLSVPLLRLTYRRPLALTVHDFFMDIYFPPRSRLGRAVKALDLRAWRSLPRIFTRVERARDHLADAGIPPQRIHVAHDPCDLNLFAPRNRDAARSRWGFAPHHLVLVHHGVMHPNKGNDRLLHAVARLRQRLPNLRFLLIGEGPQYEHLQDLIHKLALGDIVHLTGWLSSMREVAEALNAADIGLVMRIGQPGDHFHVTSTLVHNLACGLPVLAVRLDGIREIIRDGHEGFFFDPDCRAEFDQCLTHLAQDPALRQRMGHHARLTALRLFDRHLIAKSMAAAIIHSSLSHTPAPAPAKK